MIKELRFEKILEFLRQNDIVSLEEASLKLKIPLTTLRRDLNQLEAMKKVIKLHGGAKLVKQELIIEDFLENKIKSNIIEKQNIALKALKIIPQNSTLFLDAGSSSYYLAKLITPKMNLTIVTNSIANVYELANNGNNNIYLLGGKFKSTTGAILGYEAIEALKNYSFDMCFLGINAVDDNGNIYTTSSDHAQIKLKIIRHSSKSFGLVDESKMHSKSFYKFATIKEVELIK